MGDGKAASALKFLDNLLEKGKVTSGAITPLKVAFSKVIQVVEGDSWEDTDVRSIDVDDYMARFANLTMGKYSHESLTAYKSRFNRVIGWYTQFLDKPGWSPDVQRRNRAPKSTAPKPKDPAGIQPQQPHAQAEAPQSMASIANAPGRVLYPYPLLDGQLVHISLPLKLSKEDARRIGVFVESIAMSSEVTIHE